MGAPSTDVYTRAALVALVLALLPLPGARPRPPARPVTPRSETTPAVAPQAQYASRTARGRVETPEHSPIAGARVRALLAHEGYTHPMGEATTDPDGRFALTGMPDGSYWIIATAADRARSIEELRVHDGDPSPLTLALVPGARIEGRVLARAQGDAHAFADATVRAWREGAAGEELPFAVKADREGRFALDGLSAGSYRVEVAELGHETLRRINVAAPSRALTLTVRALASLTGQVRTAHGDGARGATVLIAGSGVWPPRSVPVLHDGHFLIEGLPSGVYELRASRDDDVAEPVAPLVLEPGDHREVDLSLGAGATLHATVVDAETRAPVAGARVIVAEDALSVQPRALASDAQGRVRAPGLLRRVHQVSVRAPGYAPRTGIAVNPAAGYAVLALDHAVVVEGRVLNARGEPVANAQVELHARDHEGAVTWLTGATVAFREALFGAQVQGPRSLVPSGELGVMPGRVPLIPLLPVPAGISVDRAAPGFTTNLDGTFRIDDVPPGMVTVTVTHPAYVRAETEEQLARAGERAELNVTLQRGGAIEGRVVTERGFPLRMTQVEVRSNADPLPRRVFTQGDGSFRVPAVRGRVALVALAGARVIARAEVTVADEAVVPVVMTVPGAMRTIEGRVVDARGYPVDGATVSITTLERSALGSSTTITRADGSFSTMVGGTRAVNLDVRHPEFAPRGLRVEDPSRPARIELARGASLEAELRSDGCLVGEARVELRTTCGPVRGTCNDSAEFTLDRLCPGRASLVIDAPGCMRVERSVTLPATGSVRVARIELMGGGSAEGDVVDGRGDPVLGAVIARVDAPADALTGAARSDRTGRFRVSNLPDGDVSIVAWHPTLGRSAPVAVRVIRATVARGVRLRFERDAASATRALTVRQVLFEEVNGAVEVRAVGAGTAPERAGLRPGDRVISLNAEAVSSAADAERRLAGVPGDDVVLEVERDGVRRTVRYARAR